LSRIAGQDGWRGETGLQEAVFGGESDPAEDLPAMPGATAVCSAVAWQQRAEVAIGGQPPLRRVGAAVACVRPPGFAGMRPARYRA